MNHKSKVCIFFILIILSINFTQAQDTSIFKNEKFAIHPKAGLTSSWHITEFSAYEGAPDCGVFKNGFSTGYSASIFGELPVFSQTHLGLGLGYIHRNGDLTYRADYETRDPDSGMVVPVQVEGSFFANLGYLEIMPEIRTVLPQNIIPIPVRVFAGFRYAFAIEHDYTQKEKAINDFVFIIDGKRLKEWVVARETMKNITPNIYGFSAGIETMLTAGKSTFFTQQFVFDYSSNNIVKDISWKSVSMRVELGVRFGFAGKTEVAPPPPPATPPPPEPVKPVVAAAIKEKPAVMEPTLSCRITGVEGVINTGEEFLASLPLVNCIFFDKGSSVVRDYYIKDKVADLSYYYGNPVDMHKNILQHISGLVNKNPNARLTLIGATSGKDNEPEGLALAKARAENVRSILTRLGIDSKKITVRSEVMPPVQSNQDYAEGIAENQRVDIVLQNAPLQEYVSVQKYAEFDGKLSAEVRFENIPDGSTPKLRANFTDKVTDCLKPGSYSFDVTKRIGKPGDDIQFAVNASSGNHSADDSHKMSTSGLKVNPVELNLSSFDAVIRFDYNSSKLTEDNKRLLKQMADFLPKGSTIVVYGSTDALGTEKRNVQLARERAEFTQEYIRSVSDNKFIIRTEASQEKFPEETPQGRFLNRSIRVKVAR